MSNVQNFRCIVCETVGKWKLVDEFRLKAEGTHMCESCGFVSYPERYKTEDEIKEYYRKDYRTVPQANAIHTGARKLNYHHFFLKPIFDEWTKLGINKPVIGEIGSAIGMFIDWVKGHFPEADITGTELTQGFKKVAKHYYGIDLKEDFDFSKKYDLIVSYHVLEHQIDADKKLKEYAACLKDSGLFYLSCPIWFRDLNVSSVSAFDLEYYWHPDHINAWSEEHLEHIISRAGLVILFKDTAVYGNTYILKKADAGHKVESKTWEPDKNLDFIDRAFKVFKLQLEHKTEAALAIYKNCPSLWTQHYEFNRTKFHQNFESVKKYLADAVANCPNSYDSLAFAGDIMVRYEKYDDAIEYFNKALSKRPNGAIVLMALANCYRSKALKEKDAKLKNELLGESIKILRFLETNALEMKDKVLSWLFFDVNQLQD